MSKSEYALLSDREEQVLLLSTKGFTDKEIAKKLELSIATVNTYWVRIRTKLGGANRAELVAAALNKNAEETLTAKELENQRLISEVVRRAEAERALRESQSRLQAIIDGTPVVVYIKDIQGRYTLVNREFEGLLNKERREILGKRDFDLFDTGYAEAHRAQDVKILETGESIEGEDVYHTTEGDRHFLSVKFPLVNAEGVRYAVCGFSREFTSRKEVEEQILMSEKRFRSLIENSIDVVTLLDSEGSIIYTSPSTEKVLGVQAVELQGQNAFKFIVREDLPAVQEDFKRLLEKPGATVVAEYRVRHTDGTIHYVEGHGTNLLEDVAVRAIVLNYRDITERKLGERRLAAQHEIAKILAKSSDLEESFRCIAEALCTTLGFDCGGVWLMSEPERKLCYCAGYAAPGTAIGEFTELSKKYCFDAGEGLPGKVFQEQKPMWVCDYGHSKYARSEIGQTFGLQSAVAFPILIGEEAEGVVECFCRRNVPADQEFLNTLSLIGQQIGQFVKRKEAEAEELRLAKQLTAVHSELDISSQHLEEQQKRYRDLFQQAPDGYVVTDLKGNILESNQAALQLFGCEENDCVGKALKDFVVQDLKNAFNAGFASLPDLDSIHEWELRIRPTDGPVFDASVSVTVVRDAKGNAVAHRWLIRDISKRKFDEHELKVANEALERRVRTRTIELEEANLRLQDEVSERKRAEDDLLNSHQFVQSVIENSMDGILAFDLHCEYTVWNRSMEIMTGKKKDDVVGKVAFQVFPVLTETKEDDFMRRTLKGESVVSSQTVFERNGKAGQFESHYSPIKNDRGEIIGGLAVIRELSVRLSGSRPDAAEMH